MQKPEPVDFDALVIAMKEQGAFANYIGPIQAPVKGKDGKIFAYPSYPGELSYSTFSEAPCQDLVNAQRKSTQEALHFYMPPQVINQWMCEFFSQDFLTLQAVEDKFEQYMDQTRSEFIVPKDIALTAIAYQVSFSDYLRNLHDAIKRASIPPLAAEDKKRGIKFMQDMMLELATNTITEEVLHKYLKKEQVSAHELWPSVVNGLFEDKKFTSSSNGLKGICPAKGLIGTTSRVDVANPEETLQETAKHSKGTLQRRIYEYVRNNSDKVSYER